MKTKRAYFSKKLQVCLFKVFGTDEGVGYHTQSLHEAVKNLNHRIKDIENDDPITYSYKSRKKDSDDWIRVL